MRLTLVIDVSPTDDVADDVDILEVFKEALKETFESWYSADPTASHETEDGEFSFEVTHNEVTVTD